MCLMQASAPSLTSLRILKDSVKALFTVPTPFACSSSTSCLKCWQKERQKGSNELQAGHSLGPGEERVTWKSLCHWAPDPSPLLAGQCHTVMDGGGKVKWPLHWQCHHVAPTPRQPRQDCVSQPVGCEQLVVHGTSREGRNYEKSDFPLSTPSGKKNVPVHARATL